MESQQQMEQGRFSGPARPDKRQPFAERDFEINRDDGRAAGSGRIGEIDSLKPAGRLVITAKRQRAAGSNRSAAVCNVWPIRSAAPEALCSSPASSDRVLVEAAARKA